MGKWYPRLQLALTQFANKRGLYFGRRSTRVHTAIYRWTKGRLGGRVPGFPAARIALVDHVGAKSGIRRTSPLICLEDAGRVVVTASKAGQPTNPNWFHNLMAHPETTVQVGGEVRDVRARVAGDEERERLWPRFVAIFPAFELYERITGQRQIPVVILERR
ncbi:MAG TPA: nitroreductase/quinone reductase family protein [Solirubrobacterales bacterium]|nr:nitroreductase/quinone reductase family protein [Solirubrobacterales bacterium]